MSKEAVRQIVSSRFNDWQGLDNVRKSYPNLRDPKAPKDGQWARLTIDFVMRKITSVGNKPCTRRTGVIVIDVFEHLDVGTKQVSMITDDLEEWFSFYQTDCFWCGAANTVDNGKSDSYYVSTVYIPFTYDDGCD